MLSKSIHGVANGNISFFFVVEKYFFVCISHLHYPSSVDGCLHIVAIVNNVINDINNDSSMNTGVHISFQISILIFFSNIYPGVDLLDHMVVLVFLKKIFVLFSTVTASIYLPTNGIQGFLFLHVFASVFICGLFDDSHWDRSF